MPAGSSFQVQSSLLSPKSLVCLRTPCPKKSQSDVDISKGVERGGDYDNDDKINDNGDVHVDLEGPLGS